MKFAENAVYILNNTHIKFFAEILIALAFLLLGIKILARQREEMQVAREDKGQRYKYEFEFEGTTYKCFSNFKYESAKSLLGRCDFAKVEQNSQIISSEDDCLYIPEDAIIQIKLTDRGK